MTSRPDPVRVIGLGAGGHAKVVLETLAAMGGFEVVGLLDPRRELWQTVVLGVPVLGDDDLLASHYASGVRHAFIGLGSGADMRARAGLFDFARAAGVELVDAVHPAAVVSPSAVTGPGLTAFAAAVVNADARLGTDVIVNTGAIVEHDCRLGDHVHVATGARLASGVELEDGVHVGAGATVIQGLTVGAGSVVGAGAVVTSDVEPGVVVAGVPARMLKPVDA